MPTPTHAHTLALALALATACTRADTAKTADAPEPAPSATPELEAVVSVDFTLDLARLDTDGPVEFGLFSDFIHEGPKTDFPGDLLDLEATSHSAMVLVLQCHLPPEDPEHCAKMFDPTRSDPILLPLVEHCGPGSAFDCRAESSFTKFTKDHYFTKYAMMTGSFLPGDRVITAAHNIDRDQLGRMFFVMNAVQDGTQWPAVDLDGDGRKDHARIDPRFMLAIDEVVDCEFYRGNTPDWAVFRVKPFLSDQRDIPPHATFELATADPELRTPIRVLGHPRLLPLKRATGYVSELTKWKMTAPFDGTQGSSGSPALLVDADVIVGISRIFSVQKHASGGVVEHECTVDDYLTKPECKHHPLTPASRIAKVLAGQITPKKTCHLHNKPKRDQR